MTTTTTTTTATVSTTPSPSPSTQPPTTSTTQAVSSVGPVATTTTTVAPVVITAGSGPPTIVMERLPGTTVTDKEIVKNLAVLIEVNETALTVKKSTPTEIEIEIDTGTPEESQTALNTALNLNTTALASMGASDIKYIIRQAPAEFDWLPIILGSLGGLLLIALIIFLLTRKNNENEDDQPRVSSVQIPHGATFSANETNERGFDDQPLLELPSTTVAPRIHHQDEIDLL